MLIFVFCFILFSSQAVLKSTSKLGQINIMPLSRKRNVDFLQTVKAHNHTPMSFIRNNDHTLQNNHHKKKKKQY